MKPIGPTDHLITPEYWKELYLAALEEGKEQLRLRQTAEVEIERLRTLVCALEERCSLEQTALDMLWA